MLAFLLASCKQLFSITFLDFSILQSTWEKANGLRTISIKHSFYRTFYLTFISKSVCPFYDTVPVYNNVCHLLSNWPNEMDLRRLPR